MHVSWVETISLIGIIATGGAFLDEHYIPSKYKEWMRERLIAIYLRTGVGGPEPPPRKENTKISLFSWYFLDDWLSFLLLFGLCDFFDIRSIWLEEGWSWGMLETPAYQALAVLLYVYTFFLFRLITSNLKGILRLAALASIDILCLSTVAGVYYDTPDSPEIVYIMYFSLLMFMVYLISLCSVFLFAEVLLGSIAGVSRISNWTAYQALNAATSPRTSPFKFAAALLGFLIALLKWAFF